MGYIGYHDARQVLRLIEERVNGSGDVEKLTSLLVETGFDERQRQFITEAVKNLFSGQDRYTSVKSREGC